MKQNRTYSEAPYSTGMLGSRGLFRVQKGEHAEKSSGLLALGAPG